MRKVSLIPMAGLGKRFIDKGYKNVIGIEPAKNLFNIANKNIFFIR